MLSTLVLLASSLAAQAAPPPSPFEILRTWTGKELDHLGIGISALGDVNDDGVPDFILGAMQGAYCFYFGPGYAQVVSGKDGSVLYTVRGTDKEGDCGDAYGDTIAALGDLDKDGVPDFGVGAWRYQNYTGYVTVYSGKEGRVLATLYGPGLAEGSQPLLVLARAAMPPEYCGTFCGSDFGHSIVGLGDLDSDGSPDFAIGAGGSGWIISGAAFSARGPLDGLVLARAGENTATLVVRASWDRLLLVAAPGFEPTTELARGREWSAFDCGDVDLDGCVDILRASPPPDRPTAGPGAEWPLPVQCISGKDGTVLHELRLSCVGLPRELEGGPLGDLDGDGRPEAYLRACLNLRGACVWILDGKTGAVLAQQLHPCSTFGRRIVPLGDIDHDGRPEFLLSDYESQQGARCGGAVHLVHIRLTGK